MTRFAVIDDEDDELDELPLFQPSAATGLTDKIVRGVIKYLDGKTDEDMRSGPVETAFAEPAIGPEEGIKVRLSSLPVCAGSA